MQKGLRASRRCDICNSKWRAPFASGGDAESSAAAWRDAATAFLEAARPLLLTALAWWKAIALARGVLQGLHAGAAGFRLGMEYHALEAVASSHSVAVRNGGVVDLVRWAPLSFWAAGALPLVQFPTFMAMYATVSSMAVVRGTFLAVGGMYAGWVTGFAEGVAHTCVASLHGVATATGLLARALAAVLRFGSAALLLRK